MGQSRIQPRVGLSTQGGTPSKNYILEEDFLENLYFFHK